MIGDKLGSKMILYGHPACMDTAKCLQTGAEKGVDIEGQVVDDVDDPEFRAISPFGSSPCLKDIEFIVYGTPAILSYLDDKGFGPSLVPRNGVVRAVMYQWIHVSTEYVAPAVKALTDGSGSKESLAQAFDAFNQHLQSPPRKGDFICGDFTLADIHWFCYVHHLYIAGAGDIIESRSNIPKWLDSVKKHTPVSKEKIKAYEMVPTAQDIQGNTLRGVSINV